MCIIDSIDVLKNPKDVQNIRIKGIFFPLMNNWTFIENTWKNTRAYKKKPTKANYKKGASNQEK